MRNIPTRVRQMVCNLIFPSLPLLVLVKSADPYLAVATRTHEKHGVLLSISTYRAARPGGVAAVPSVQTCQQRPHAHTHRDQEKVAHI